MDSKLKQYKMLFDNSCKYIIKKSITIFNMSLIYLLFFCFCQSYAFPEELLDYYLFYKPEYINDRLVKVIQEIKSEIEEIKSKVPLSNSKLENDLKNITEKLNSLEKNINTIITPEISNIKSRLDILSSFSSELNTIKLELNKTKEEIIKIEGDFTEALKNSSKKINAVQNTMEQLNNKVQDNLNLLTEYSFANNEIAQKISDLEKKISNSSEKVTNSNMLLLNKITNRQFSIFLATVIIVILISLYFITKILKLEKKISNLSETNNIKLIESYEKLVSSIDDLFNNLLSETGTTRREEAEEDHKWALFVANEINTIERNLKRMDPETVGLKQLNKSINKLRDRLSSNGYEMPVLLGVPYNEGMSINVVNFIEDESLSEGKLIISKVLIPQVNYREKMIQQPHVEVSKGVKKEV